jgi:hypothetical protein
MTVSLELNEFLKENTTAQSSWAGAELGKKISGGKNMLMRANLFAKRGGKSLFYLACYKENEN